MKTVIDVTVEFQGVSLLLADYRAAREFKDFVTTYVDESGVTNGFGAYWATLDVSLNEITVEPEELNNYVIILEQKYLNKMVSAIIKARNLDEEIRSSVVATFTANEDGIKFICGEFPDRQVSEVGDMCRFLRKEGAPHVFDGIVVGEKEGIFSVVNPIIFDPEAEISSETEIIKIPVSQTMKIRDWRR